MAPPADRTSVRIVLIAADGQETAHDLEPGRTVTLGRDPSNTVVLPSYFVSKRHARVTWDGAAAHLADQDSANGVVLNGLTVQAADLAHGDVIQLGDQRLRFEAVHVVDAVDVVAVAPVAPAPEAPAIVPVRRSSALPFAVLALLLFGVGALVATYLFVLTPATTNSAGRKP